MAAVVAAAGFWNQRERLNTWPAYIQANVCKVRVDEDVLKDTINSLALVYPKLRQTELWSELAIIKKIAYKHRNQHRKQFYFQGLRRVVKNLNRLQEIRVCSKLGDVRNSFVSLQKNRLISDMLPSYPSIELIVNMLGCLTGAAQIMLQVVSFCQETFKFSCSELVGGYFVSFHLTLVSSMSRVWVYLKGFMLAVAECYDIIFPWLNLLEDTLKTENSEAKDLPKSLKTWLEPLKNEGSNRTSNSASVTAPTAKTLTPGTLDKLFASTPRENPKDTSPSFLPANADSLTEPSYDLGELFVSDDVMRPLKHPDAMVADENSDLKRKLFPESPENDEHVPINSTQTRKRKATEFIDREVSNTPTKKLAMDLKIFLNTGGLCRRFRATIRIFGKKTWKHTIDKKLRKKLAQRQVKKKQRRRESNTDSAPTKKRRKVILSRDEVCTKTERKANSKEETRAKKKRKEDTRHDKSYTKEKRKLKSHEGKKTCKVVKKQRKEETNIDSTRTREKRIVNTVEDETHPKKKKRVKLDEAETKAKKKRTVKPVKAETKTKKKRTVKPGETETKARKKRTVKLDEAETKAKKKRTVKPDGAETKTKKKRTVKPDETETKARKKRTVKLDEAETKAKRKRTVKPVKAETKTKKKRTVKPVKAETRAKKKRTVKPDGAETRAKKKRTVNLLKLKQRPIEEKNGKSLSG